MGERTRGVLTGIGLCAVLLLSLRSVEQLPKREAGSSVAAVAQGGESLPARVRFLAVGDVNLGRTVGRVILKGDTLYPFAAVRDTFAQYDVVFANLESPLSDQDGETERPGHNMIFTGPPAGAQSLRRAGITVVSTANNHALDYGSAGCKETGMRLEEAGVQYAGTAHDSAGVYEPALFARRGIRMAVFACTDVMNSTGSWWKRYVASADTGALLPAVRRIRDSVDFIVVSYHGGTEYGARPTKRTEAFAAAVIGAGADLFLGHHPHVCYGLEELNGKLVATSLGNFVFRQPDRFWTQRTFALAAEIVKDTSGTHILHYRCMPALSGFQPTFTLPDAEAGAIRKRITMLSQRGVMERISW